MNILTLQALLEGTLDGILTTEEIPLNSVAIDSRLILPNSIFFCIKGETVDGHNFIDEAYKKGAILAITELDIPQSPLPYIKVKSTVKALGLLANYKRQQQNNTVIAITGSAGKTTIKELLSHILGFFGTVAKNPLNHNNQIGMPLALLNADINADIWILEVGISEDFDMKELGEILQPDIVYITNAGMAHTEGLGEKGVAYHKASLLKYLRTNNSSYLTKEITPKAFIPQSSTELIQESKAYTADICYYSSSFVHVEYKGINKESTLGKYTITYQEITHTIFIPYTGHFMEDNLCGVITLALYLGVDFSLICESLSSVVLVKQRNILTQHKTHYSIDDTYNANPVSMKAMIDALYSLPVSTYIFILGDMNELGNVTDKEHYQIGQYIASFSKDKNTAIFWKGQYSSLVKKGLDDGQYIGEYSASFTNETITTYLTKASITPVAVLCKGSRAIELEEEYQIIFSFLEGL